MTRFKNIFCDEISSGLPAIRGSAHQINLVHGSYIPNLRVYKSNSIEINELQRKVEKVKTKRLYKRKHESICSSNVVSTKKKKELEGCVLIVMPLTILQ